MDTFVAPLDAQLTGVIDLVDEAGGPVLRLRGDVDTLVVDAWRASTPRGSRAPVAVDVSGATFLDCRGLRLLVQETEGARRAGRVPELRRPSRGVQRLLEVAGAAPLFATVG
ncbi:STAS domain-containing protein [Modestobacter versicolor]|uniref:STAS domain-containing protein n=1 Tax=Modestobacter versicolor TaxID=429133 RepID=UPI0034DE3F28